MFGCVRLSFPRRRETPLRFSFFLFQFSYDFVSLIYTKNCGLFLPTVPPEIPWEKKTIRFVLMIVVVMSIEPEIQVAFAEGGMHPVHLCVGMQVKAWGGVSPGRTTLFVISMCHLCVCLPLCLPCYSRSCCLFWTDHHPFVSPDKTPNTTGCPLAQGSSSSLVVLFEASWVVGLSPLVWKPHYTSS